MIKNKCFKLAKTDMADRAEIKALIADHVEFGMNESKAALKVVKGKLKEAETERTNIIKFISKNQPKVEAPKPSKKETQPVVPEIKEVPEMAPLVKPVVEKKAPAEIETAEKKDKDVEAVVPKKKDEKYAAKTTFKDSDISLKDVKSIFKGQKVGKSPDGTIFVRTALGRGVQIKSVETISPDEAAFEVGYSRMKASGELVAGKYQDGTITVSRVGDKWTLAHESEHWMEDTGLINKNDQKALSGEINRRIKKGTWKTLNPDDIGGKEDRAEFIARELKKRSDSRSTVQRVIQKIQDLIDAFVNLYKRTARGVTRDIESGKIFEKKEVSAINQFAQDIKFSLKEASKKVTDNPNFVKWFGDSEVVDENGDPLVVYHGTKDVFKGFRKSIKGIYFTDNPKVASSYAIVEDLDIEDLHPLDQPNVIPTYLSIQNPLIINADGMSWAEITDDAIKKAKKQKKDGLILKNLADFASFSDINETQTVYIAFEPTQIKSIYNTGAFSPTDPDIRFMVAGKKAIGAPTGALNKAQEMLDKGADKKEVWKETGWLKGAEGEWKFEIDDSGAKLILGKSHDGKTYPVLSGKLKSILTHKKLFEAYPELQDINIETIGESTGLYTGNTIGLNHDLLEIGKENELKETLLHEIQHAIQGIEGFDRGGSQKTFEAIRQRDENNLSRVIKNYSKLLTKYSKEGNKEQYAAVLKVRDELTQEFIKLQDHFGEKSFADYMKLAGEIEARDTAYRAKLTPEQRREQPLYESQDIPESDWTIKKGDGTSFSVGQPEQYSVKTPKEDKWAKDFLKKYGVDPQQRARAAPPVDDLIDKTKTGTFQETLEPVLEEDYISNRKINRDTKLKAATSIKRVVSEVAEIADKYLGSISTRLGQVSPKLKFKLRKLDFDITTKSKDSIKAVEPLFRKAKKMTREDFADWDYARKNSDIEKINELINKYGMQKEYIAYRKVLDGLRKEGLDVGLEIGELEEYAPRILKDSRGFLAAIGKAEEWPIYSRRLQERAQELEITVAEMTPDMKADIISNMILGGWVGLGGIPATKQRKLQKIPAYLNKYYMDSDAALMQHIHSIRKVIESRKFFGEIPQKVSEMRTRLHNAQAKVREINKLLEGEPTKEEADKLKTRRDRHIGLGKQYTAYISKYALQRDYTENIGSYIMELISNKEIAPKHEQVVNDILNARFHEVGTHGIVRAYKNMSYIDTMGSPISALTQIGDLAWAAYEGGLMRTLKYASISAVGKSRITRQDVGFERIAQEFADSGMLGKAVTKVFKIVGLEKIDAIGKEALLNTALDKYQKQAKKNPSKLKKQLRPIFEGETDSVIDDLVNDEISENVKLLVYSRVLDFQPMALSEMPQGYLTAGNGRLFYMLKTFTIKVFDVYRNEVYYKIKKGNKAEKIQGLKNLTRLSFFFVLANAGADELKDWVLGRETDLSDRLVDNMLRLFGISKFVTWKARTEGVGSALARQILPPFKFVDSLGKDIITAGDEKGLEVVGSIPVVGKLAYWHIGRGVSKRGDLWDRRWRKRKAKLNKVQDKLEKSKDKGTFRREHRDELIELRQINRLQGRLNSYRKRINRSKSREETVVRKKRIQQLESKRTSLIKDFLGSKTETKSRLNDFTKEYVTIRNAGKNLNELKKSVIEFNRKQTETGGRTIPWSRIVKKGNRIRKAKK